MIVVEKNKNKFKTDYNSFGDMMRDGRMTEKSNGKVYRLREAIMYSKMIGRELTDDEIMKFEL